MFSSFLSLLYLILYVCILLHLSSLSSIKTAENNLCVVLYYPLILYICVCVCLFVLYSFHICSTNKTKDKTNNPSEEKQNLKVNRRVDT